MQSNQPKGLKQAVVQAVEPADRDRQETVYTVAFPGEHWGKPILVNGLYYTYEQLQPLYREGMIFYRAAEVKQFEGLHIKGVYIGK